MGSLTLALIGLMAAIGRTAAPSSAAIDFAGRNGFQYWSSAIR
jgi:hypothetical protein